MLFETLLLSRQFSIYSRYIYEVSYVKNHLRLSTLLGKQDVIKRKMDEHLKCRENPVIMKLSSPEFKSIFTPELETLVAIFKNYGYELRIAGGAVRDLLSGNQPTDLDFATVATPQQMKDMFTAEEVRLINLNGEKHGTITPRINDKENFEVTTLRIDVVTDGRHAEVQFTTDWKLDANRRDLTINSMFLGLDGSVYDYFYGYDDLKKKRIAFVGNPDQRIKEDYLRILRYFRFYGRICDRPDLHEASTLQAIGDNVSGLQRVSGERIWVELKKTLDGNMGGDLMQTMIHIGIGKYIGFPDHPDLQEFQRLWDVERSKQQKDRAHAITLLAALLRDQDEFMVLHNRLKLSSYERDLGVFLIANREIKLSVKPLLPYQKLVLNSSKKIHDAQCWVRELMKYQNKTDLLEQFDAWAIPRFPVNGNQLKENGVPGGKMIGPVMNKLKNIWAENDFKSTAEDLIKHIPDILDEMQDQIKVKKK